MSQSIRAVIVEDEDRGRETLKKLLKEYCHNVIVVDEAENLSQAIQIIEKNKPELVFLDIALPDGNGYDIFHEIKDPEFEVIFVTAYSQYAIQAFEYAAIHYLLKPIDPEKLIEAVKRFERGKSVNTLSKDIFLINEKLNEGNRKILLPTMEGFQIIELKNIMYCEADRNYTTFYLVDSSEYTVSKSIGYYEDILNSSSFSRVHSKYIVNLQFVRKFLKANGGALILKNNKKIQVSRSKRNHLLEQLGKLADY